MHIPLTVESLWVPNGLSILAALIMAWLLHREWQYSADLRWKWMALIVVGLTAVPVRFLLYWLIVALPHHQHDVNTLQLYGGILEWVSAAQFLVCVGYVWLAIDIWDNHDRTLGHYGGAMVWAASVSLYAALATAEWSFAYNEVRPGEAVTYRPVAFLMHLIFWAAIVLIGGYALRSHTESAD